MRPWCPVVRALACLLLVGTARQTHASDIAPARHAHATDHVTRPCAGVVVTERLVDTPGSARLLVAQVTLRTAGLAVRVSPPSGTREVTRETTLGFLARTGACVAVNGHFFLPFPSEDADARVIGLAASEGRVFSAFETPEQDYAIVADAPALHVSSKGRARIVHRRPGGDGTRIRERGRLWTAIAGSAQVITRGQVTIPAYRDAAHPVAALRPGPDGRYDTGRSWYDLVTSRTIAGVSRDGRTLTLATVQGAARGDGLTVGQFAAVLAHDFGVWDALNLDGGGSTSMAWRDPATGRPALLTTSTENPEGRRVATSLAVIAPPVTAARR